MGGLNLCTSENHVCLFPEFFGVKWLLCDKR